MNELNDTKALIDELYNGLCAAIDEWGQTPSFLIVNPRLLSYPGLFALNSFDRKFINNREFLFYNTIPVLQTELLTDGVFPYKFVK